MGVDNFRYDLIQKVGNVDKTKSLTFNDGRVEIGTQQWVNIPGTFILSAYGNAFVNNVLSFGLAYRESGANFPCNKINFYPVAGYGNGIGLSSDSTNYYAGGPYSGSSHAWHTGATDTTFGTERMRIVSNGNVGIGTTSPSYKCHIKCTYDVVASGLHLDASDASQYTLTIWPFVIGGGEVGWRFRTISHSGGTNTPLEFRHNDETRFQVDKWIGDSDGNLRFFLASANNILYFGGGQTNALLNAFVWRQLPNQADLATLNTNGVMSTYGYASLSDSRIKKDIEDIDDVEGLNKLLLVQPKKYNYIEDMRNKGFGKVFGFIAQQIKEVIPEEITMEKRVIANVSKKCLVYNKREIYHSIPQDVAIDTDVSITIGDTGKRYKIKEIYDDYFIIDEDIDEDECFVYGYEIDDLHVVDKNYIFTLNVCATQELHRRMEVQNVIIKSQDERIKELEIKIEKLMNYISI